MAEIKISSTLLYHRKLEKLMKDAEIGRVEAIGHLVIFWLWCDEKATKGLLPKLTDWEIAAAAKYEGNAKRFATALIDANFLDRAEDSLSVHDWDQWLLLSAKRRLARRVSDGAPDGTPDGAPRGTPRGTPNDDQTANTGESSSPSQVFVVKDTGEAAVRERRKSPQEEFVLRFKAFYEVMVKKPFKYGRPHFVIAQKLITEFGFDAVVEKSKILARMCRDRSAWFTKSGWADFSLEKLSTQWNSIIPEAEQPSREDEFAEEMRRRRSDDERINRLMGK